MVAEMETNEHAFDVNAPGKRPVRNTTPSLT